MKNKGVREMQTHVPMPQKPVDLLLNTFRKLDMETQSQLMTEFKNILRDRLKVEDQSIAERMGFLKETFAKHNL